MRIKIKIFIWIVLFFNLNESISAVEKLNCKTVEISAPRDADLSLPLRVTPLLVDAPARHIDLIPKTKQRDTKIITLDFQGPLDLNDYPVLTVNSDKNLVQPFAYEFGLSTGDKDELDTLLYVGDPAFFPSRDKEIYDFKSVDILPRTLFYQIKRKFGWAGDRNWRYTNNKAVKVNLVGDKANLSFNLGGAFALQKAFATKLIDKPWLSYEYETPKGSLIGMQISAKFSHNSRSKIWREVHSEVFRESGKRRVLINLYDLVRKIDARPEKSNLEELYIIFSNLEDISTHHQITTQNIEISLGRIELFKSEVESSPAPTNLLFVGLSDPHDAKVDLFDKVNSQLQPHSKQLVLSAKILGFSKDTISSIPQARFQMSYQQKVPKLFVGESYFLDALSGFDLSKVLDQKLFIEKRELWNAGKSAAVFIKTAGQLITKSHQYLSEASVIPLASYSLNLAIPNNSYIVSDFSFEEAFRKPVLPYDLPGQLLIDSEGQPIFVIGNSEKLQIDKGDDDGHTLSELQEDIHRPLLLNISGESKKGEHFTKDFLLASNIPMRLSEMRIKKIEISYLDQTRSGAPLPQYCRIKNFQISSFIKKNAYQVKPSISYLSNQEPPSGINTFWKNDPVRLNIVNPEDESLQTIKNILMDLELGPHAHLNYAFTSSWDHSVSLFLKVIGIEANRHIEKIYQLNQLGDLPLGKMHLKNFSFLAQIHGKPPFAPSSEVILMQKFELSNFNQSVSALENSSASKVLGAAPRPYLVPFLEFDVVSEFSRRNLGGVQSLDTSLSFEQILSGGKDIAVNKYYLKKDSNKLSFLSDSFVDLNLSSDFLNDLEKQKSNSKGPITDNSYIRKLGSLIIVITVALLIFLLLKLKSKWRPILSRILSFKVSLRFFEYLLMQLAFYKIFINENHKLEAFSWSGLLLVMIYGLSIHYKLRPYLAKKWPSSSLYLSAPYFLMFIFLLLVSAILMIFKLNEAVEQMAAVCYYLLVMGVFVEFLAFAKDLKSNPKTEA